MSDIKTLKTQAQHLRRSLAAKGLKLSHSESLEAIAAQYGFDTWDALVGTVKSTATRADAYWKHLSLADVGILPDEVWVEAGNQRVLCEVGYFDYEGLVLLHKPKELEAYLKDAHDGDATTEALVLYGDGRDYKYTYAQLRGLRFERLGGKYYWYAPEVDTYLEFAHWTPTEPVTALRVPELSRAPLASSLVVVPSADHAKYNALVVVPATLDPARIAQQLDEEIRRLKAVDAAKPATDDSEYGEEDLAAFAQSLGCQWMLKTTYANETWD